MTDAARDVVLGRIRRALRRTGPASEPHPPIERAYRRAGDHPAGDPALLELLTDRLHDYGATVLRSAPQTLPADVAQAVAATLPPGGTLLVPAGLPPGWVPPDATVDGGDLSTSDVDACDGVLTTCAAAAADTGTIVLDGSPGQGRRLITLIPDRHVCVVTAAQVVQTVPELLARLDPCRPLTFVSGPSATSDIELQRVQGVHGPRTLTVVLVA